jgi:hypothetical protein
MFSHFLRALVFLFLCTLSSAWAAPLTFDISTITPPPGFTIERGAGQVQLTLVEANQREFVRLALYAAQPASGDAAHSFAQEWNATVATNWPGHPPPAPTNARTASGHTYLEGTRMIQMADSARPVSLTMFALGDKVVSVLIIASDPAALARNRPVLVEMLNGVQFAGLRSAPAATSPVAPSPPAKGQATGRGSPVVGIWAALRNAGGLQYNPFSRQMDMQSARMEIRWRTFFADGTAFEGLPEHGMLRLDLAAERANPYNGAFWGQWSASGDRVSMRQLSGRTLDYTLRDGELVEDPKTSGNARFTRLASVDGLRLNGTWSTSQQWNESNAGSNWTSVPVIQFSRDGRFVDRGAFMYTGIERLTAENVQRHPGKGSYDIRSFTLTLRYDDGREVLRALVPPMKKDAAVDDRVIYIGQFPFHRQ